MGPFAGNSVSSKPLKKEHYYVWIYRIIFINIRIKIEENYLHVVHEFLKKKYTHIHI